MSFISLETHEMEFLVFFLLIFRELKIIMKNGGILKSIFRWASMLWILYEFNDNRINLLKLLFKVLIFYGFSIRNFQKHTYPKLVFHEIKWRVDFYSFILSNWFSRIKFLLTDQWNWVTDTDITSIQLFAKWKCFPIQFYNKNTNIFRFLWNVQSVFQ